MIPIVPVAISGAYEAMSSGKKRIKSGSKIVVNFCLRRSYWMTLIS